MCVERCVYFCGCCGACLYHDNVFGCVDIIPDIKLGHIPCEWNGRGNYCEHEERDDFKCAGFANERPVGDKWRVDVC